MSYDDVYDDDAYPAAGRILWGRIAFFAVALLVVFLLGRMTAGGGASQEDLEAAEAEIQQLSEQNETLEQQVSELSGEQVDPGAEEQPAPTEQPTGAPPETTDGGTEAPAGGGQTYEVQSGDTLIDIAQEVYGDSDKWQLIAEANGLDGDNRLVVGQELQIPPDPDG